MKKLFKAITLSLVALLLISMPVLAAVAYRAAYTIIESASTPYSMLPVLELADNEWMSANGFFKTTALDTRIETLGGLLKPHMVATNKTLTAVPVPADSQTNLYFTTANPDLSPPAMDIITGYNGYITITDDDTPAQQTLELGNDFEIEIDDAYINTDANTVSFQAAGVVSEAANGNITPALPVGWAVDDIWLCLITSLDNINSTLPGGWTAIDTGTNNTAAMRTTLYWRRAVTGDAAPLVTHAAGSGISAVIVGYSGVTPVGSPFNINQAVYVKAPASIVNNFGAGMTTTVNNDTIVLLSGVGGQTTSITYTGTPTPTERVDAPNTADRPSLVIADFPLVTAGATGARTSTITSFLNNGYQLSLIPVRKNLVYKKDAFSIYTGIVAEEVTAEIGAGGGEDTFASNTSDADASATNVVYNTAWIAANADGVTTGDAVRIGQTVAFGINRAAFYFDTSALPDFATITAAQLRLYGKEDGSADDFDIVIQTGSGGHPADPLVLADYDKTFYSGDGGSVNTLTFTIAGYNEIDLNATGMSWINLTGLTKLVLRSGEDIAGSQPIANEYVNVWTFDKAGEDFDPQLVITYETPSITAINVESGPHDINVGLTGGTFSISIDSAVAGDGYDDVAFAGSVPSNDNDWLIMDNSTTDFMPYMGFYKHTTAIGGESLKAWYQPNTMVTSTSFDGIADAGSDATSIVDAALTDPPNYWVGALVTITNTADHLAPEGQARVCTVYAVGDATVDPAFSAAVDAGDTYTIDFGTLVDRSYYGLEFDAVDDVVACGAAADMDITDKATLTAWVYIDTDGETNEGSIIDRRDATPDGYRLYVSSEAGGNVAIEAILDCATDAYAKTAVEISTGAWHYIVAVYDRLGTNRWEIYEDGTLLTLGTDTAGVGAIVGHTANVMNIGDNAASNRCFDGKIDEPSFYTTAWTQALVTANYNAGAGLYTPTDTTSIALQLHMEEGTGAAVADTSGEANNGTITNALWVNGKVPRPAGNAGTNDSRLTWGANPTGVAVALGGMVSEGQPTPSALPVDPAQDILLETEVTDWFIGPAVGVGESLRANPLRPFVTMWSDNSTLTELQCWRLYAFALILLITVATAMAVGHHQGVTAIMAGVAILGAVVLTIFPMWALVFAIGMFIGGLVMERSPSL